MSSLAERELFILAGWLYGCDLEAALEELFDTDQYLGSGLGLVDGLAQGRASGDAVSEPGGELLHLAFCSGHFFFEQHLEIGADHLVAVGLGGLVVGLGLSG